MELRGPRPTSARNDLHLGEEGFHESQRYSPWSSTPAQVQHQGFSERNSFNSDQTHGGFGSPGGFGRFDSAPNQSDQFWSRRNGDLGNNRAKAAPVLNRGRGRGRVRRY